MKKIVFICKGNIFRSQVAKVFYNKYKKDDSIALSYGTWVSNEGFEGREISSLLPVFPGLKFVFSELEKYGLEILNSKCTQVQKEFLEDADKIIVMTEKEFIPEWFNEIDYGYWENIPNPESIDQKTAGSIIKLIKEKVLKLIG